MDKLLNKLTDEIDTIEDLAFQTGQVRDFILFSRYDKKLSKHKTKALQIIEKLRKL